MMENRFDPIDTKTEGSRSSFLLWILIIAFAAVSFWAYFYKIDQVVRGRGNFIAPSRVQVIQAVDGGTITELRVKEGDRVEKGQVLAVLDQSRFSASAMEIEARLASLYARAARLRAEITGSGSINFPIEVKKFPELMETESALYRQRRKGFSEEMRTSGAAVALAREDAGLVEELAKNGDVSRSEVIRARRILNDAEAQMVNRRNKYYEETGTELSKAEDAIMQNEQIYAQRMQQLEDTELKASVPGIVKNMRLTTAGSVLRPGEELMQIVPIGDQLIVEVKIRPADIGQLSTGMQANIRVDPYDYTIYGAVSGIVSYISADTLKEDTKMGEQVYYRVYINTKGGPVVTQTGKQIEILPGMTCQVDIRTGDRTVLEYVLKPLRKTLTESMGER